MDRSQGRQAAPYRLQVSRPLLHAYTISDGRHEPVVGYALPVTRTMPTMPAMATTARPGPAAGSKLVPEPEEDIAAIAKQISDHAEAIYQTWKSRGLAPTEILNMPQSSQAMEQLVNKFVVEDKARQAARQGSPTATAPSPTSPGTAPKAIEKLVNSFVVEDKAARQMDQLVSSLAAEPHGSPIGSSPGKRLPSSIQFALQKFENKASTPPGGQDNKASSPLNQPTKITPKAPTPASQQPLHHKEIFLETIETSFPEDLIPSKVQNRGSPTAVSPVDVPDAGSGVTTWPLKNKVTASSAAGQRIARKNSSEYLDEVARQEERLINALKTGIILTEDPKKKSSPTGSPTTDKASPVTSPVKKEKPAVTKDSERAAPQPLKPRPVLGPGMGPVLGPVGHVNLGPAAPTSPVPVNKMPHPVSRPRQPAASFSPNPVRPFLTRGSVAERVLIFEKCPTELLLDNKRRPVAASWRGSAGQQTPTYGRDKDSGQGSGQGRPPGTLQRQARASRNHLIPRFYFPQGKPVLSQHLDLVLRKVAAAFDNFPNQQVPRHQFGAITKACDCPLYWKIPLFIACGGDKAGYVDVNSFLDYWRNLCSSCHNPASRFMNILTRGQRQYLLPEDLIPLVQDVVETHPGLTFLKEATEFHSRYVHTVIARVYYCVNRSWSGRISLAELRRSNLLAIIKLLEEEDDINAITQYFSYEHFYVIYCKFWELDRDHDLFIDRHDLARHSDHALSSRMIERIFSGAVTRGGRHKLREDRMSYTEFVWFLLSEEDKTHPTAIEYWFRCMDLDGDGFLSMYELEYFYEEQLQRMDAIGIETLPFEDCLCQMLDMLRPEVPGKISLSDLKRCKMTSIFFDTFFNLEKYLDHEQRDPFASQRDHDNEGRELSDWDRYAAEEYELLVAEEAGPDQQEDIMFPEDEEDVLSPNLDKLSWPSKPSFKVTDFDLDLGALDNDLGESDDSDDYAGDSDEDDEEGSI